MKDSCIINKDNLLCALGLIKEVIIEFIIL